jgi:hypothetical protein
MAFSFAALLPVMLLPSFRPLHRPTLERSWTGLLAVGACFALNIGLNNMSLVTISLSLNQVIRWAVPAATCGRAGGVRAGDPWNEGPAALPLDQAAWQLQSATCPRPPMRLQLPPPPCQVHHPRRDLPGVRPD